MSFFNYEFFYEQMAAKPDYRVFVELGVYAGDSASFLHQQLVKRGTPFELYGFDLWEQVRRTGYNRPLEPHIRQMAEHRFKGAEHVHLIQEESSEAANRFANGSVDFVFIDANHSLEFVLRDIQAWLPKVRKGGTISGHDFREPCGVEEAVVKVFGEGNFSVKNTVWWKEV